MLKPFHAKFDRLERERTELFKLLDSLDEKIIYYKETPEKWSVMQIIFHLVKSEQLSLLVLNKNLKESNKLAETGIKSILRSVALKTALRSRFKIKAPPMVSNPPEKYDLNELKIKWETIRNQLNVYLENYPKELIHKDIYRHPIAGWLNINQTLEFFNDHFDHHNLQIRKLIKFKK